MEIKKYINGSPFLHELFKNFTDEDLGKIDVVHYACDMTMIKRNTPSNYIYILVSGICGMFNELENGDVFCYYKISNYDVIGVSEVLVDNYARNANILALTNVVAFKIHKNDLRKWTVKYPDFYSKIVFNIIERLHSTLKDHVECKKYSSHANVVSYLIHSYKLYKKIYKEYYSGDVKINETRSMISDFIGISLRSINSSIEILKNMNLITVKLGKIYINHEQYIKLVDYKKELLM